MKGRREGEKLRFEKRGDEGFYLEERWIGARVRKCGFIVWKHKLKRRRTGGGIHHSLAGRDGRREDASSLKVATGHFSGNSPCQKRAIYSPRPKLPPKHLASIWFQPFSRSVDYSLNVFTDSTLDDRTIGDSLHFGCKTISDISDVIWRHVSTHELQGPPGFTVYPLASLKIKKKKTPRISSFRKSSRENGSSRSRLFKPDRIVRA